MCVSSPSCLVTIALRYLRQFFFLQAQGLHSIWLMWKQMCFRRADWAFIAALRKLGFTVSVALKENDSQVPEKLFCVTVSLLVHRRYTLRQQSV